MVLMSGNGMINRKLIILTLMFYSKRLNGAPKTPKSYCTDSSLGPCGGKTVSISFLGRRVSRYRNSIKMYSATVLVKEKILLLAYFGDLNSSSKCLEMFFYDKTLNSDGGDSLSKSPH